MAQADHGSADAAAAAGSLPDQLVQQLEDRVAQEQAEARLPSLVAGLARDGTLLWCGAQGSGGLADDKPASVSTQYRIGSISKTFTAVMVMRLRDEGELGLNDTVGQHLPELSDLPVTLAQLLSHTSGLRAEPRGPWWERTPGVPFADLVSSSARPSDLLWRPGRRFHYSNIGFGILGELVARKRSAPYGDVVRHELLAPLDMRHTTFRPVAPHAEGLAVHPHADLVLREPEHDAVAMAPAGQLWSTIGDLVIWSGVLAGHRPEVVVPGTVAEMAEPIGIFNVPGQPWTSAYGLGLQLWNSAGQQRYGHSGAMPGHWAMLLVDDATKDVVAALANSTYQGHRPEFFNDLLSMLGSGQPRQRPPFRPQDLDDGTYYQLLGDVVLGAGRVQPKPRAKWTATAKERAVLVATAPSVAMPRVITSVNQGILTANGWSCAAGRTARFPISKSQPSCSPGDPTTPDQLSRAASTTRLGSPRDGAVEAGPGLAPASVRRITCCQNGTARRSLASVPPLSERSAS